MEQPSLSQYDDPKDITTDLAQCRCECLIKTERAIMIRHENGRDYWIPQSQIHADSEVWRKGQSGRLVVKTWVARDKGIPVREYREP